MRKLFAKQLGACLPCIWGPLRSENTPGTRPRFTLEEKPPRAYEFRGLGMKTHFKSVALSPEYWVLKDTLHCTESKQVYKDPRGRILPKVSVITARCPQERVTEERGRILEQGNT